MQVRGSLRFEPAFHGAHQWVMALDADGGSLRITHPCTDTLAASLPALGLRTRPSADELRGESVCLDGMTTHVDCQVDDIHLQGSVWGLNLREHPGLWGLAECLWHSLYATGPVEYRPYLEHLYGYLIDGLPALRTGELGLRIFGRLASGDEGGLQRLFGECAAQTHIDMSNFEGMGTLLYPIFLAADKDIPVDSWRVNAAARMQLMAAGISEEKLVDATERIYSGRRLAVQLKQLTAPDRVAAVVAELSNIDLSEARAMLDDLPRSLGPFPVEEVDEAIQRLREAGAEIGFLSGAGVRTRVVKSFSP